MEYTSREPHFKVAFHSFPVLVPRRMDTDYGSGFKRWRGAAARRTFRLWAPWTLELEVEPADFDGSDLSGTIVIPVSYAGEETILDGASVPMTWLVSFLSFGLLRPVGVMLTASIVHDFAFQHGVLLRERGEGREPEVMRIQRHHADRLFGRTIATVNRMRLVGCVGWLAVRLGWLWVPYAGQRWGAPVPWGAFAVLPVALGAGLAGVLLLGPLPLISAGTCGYLLAYLILWMAGPPTCAPAGSGGGSGATDDE
jgi:hypothetical protein